MLARAEGVFSFPSRFALVGAANPCPCGFLGDPQRACSCAEHVLERYRTRIGGPLLDRIDMHLRVNQERIGTVLGRTSGDSSQVIRERVHAAQRFQTDGRRAVPSRLSGARLMEAASLDTGARGALTLAAESGAVSGRGITRLIRIARTIADLELSHAVRSEHIDEAYSLRAPERAGALA